MKKITLLLFAFFLSWQIHSQVGIIQNFDGTTFPATFTQTGNYGVTTVSPCAGPGAIRQNLYSFNSSGSLVTPTAVANATDAVVTFQWRTLEFSEGSGVGLSGVVKYSVDNGTTYIAFGDPISASSIQTCQTWTATIPAASIPAGSNFKLKIESSVVSGDFWFYIDELSVVQQTSTAPLCTTVTTPANNALNVSSSIISWAVADGIPTGYKISVGSESGATDVLDMQDVGNVTTYNVGALDAGTNYYVTVFPYNANGTATGCTESVFTTCDENSVLNENFDTASTGSTAALPACWDRLGTTGSSYVTTGSIAPASPSNRWYLYASATTVAYVHTPILNNLSANTHRLKFKAYSSTANKIISIGYLSTSGDVSTFVTIQDINLGSGTSAASILEYVVNPGALPAGVNKLVFKNNSQNATIYFDDVIWEPQPTTVPVCATNVVAATNATCGNFANTITWDAVTGIDGYKLFLGTTTGGTEVLNNFNTTATSYTFSGNPGTAYYFTVVPFNLVGNATGCTEITFTTNTTGCYCASNPTSNDGLGITNVQLVATNFPTTDVTYFDHTATSVDVQQGVNTNLQISFATGYTYNTHVWIDFNNNFTFETSELVYSGESLSANPTVLNASFMMPATAALGTHRMRIGSADSGQVPANPCFSGSYGVTLDFTVNVSPAPPCLPPSTLTATSVSPTSHNIGWTENGTATSWDIEWGLSGFTATGTPTVSATSNNPYLLTGLISNTAYQFYVRAICSTTETSAWSGPFTFTTACGVFGNFSENFDGLTTTNTIPNCWSRILSGTGLSTFATVGSYTFENNSAPNSIQFYNSSSPNTANMMLVSPVMSNLSAGTNRLRFFAKNSTETQDLQIGTMSNPADASTFTVLATVDINTTWSEYSVSFAGYTGTDTHFAFRRLSTSTYTYVYLDNVVWEPIPTTAPTCSAITSPTDGAENVMSTRVTWASNADATGYKISVGESVGGTEVLNMQDVGNVLNYTFAGDPGTTYHVTVYPYNANGQATGCTEISFTTCDALNAPFLETFAAFLPTCWQAADNGNLVDGPATFGSSNWAADSFSNTGAVGAIKYNIYTTSANDWIISPVVNIPATGYELKFDAAVTQWNGTGAPGTPWDAGDKVEILVSTSGTSNWTVLETFDNTNLPAPAGEVTIIDLDTYGGQMVRFAIRAVEGATDGGDDTDFFIDNFEVRLTPATAPVCPTNVVVNINNCGNFSNAITWAVSPGADGYKISVGTTAGGTEVANNVDLGNVLTYSLTGSINTQYYYTVVAYNAFGTSTCTESSFTTSASGCYCASNPTSVDNSGITNVQVVSTNFPNTNVTYFNHTATPVDIEQGVNANVAISFATGYTYNSYVLIDFNDDFDFADAGEVVFTGESLATNPTVLSASFLMPMTAPLGAHRMRIVTADDLTALNACYSGSYGVTLDFTINVTASLSTTDFDTASFKAYPNPVKDVFTIAYSSDITKVSVNNLLGQEVYSEKINATSTQIDMSQLSAGAYIVNVTIGDVVKTVKVVKQ